MRNTAHVDRSIRRNGAGRSEEGEEWKKTNYTISQQILYPKSSNFRQSVKWQAALSQNATASLNAFLDSRLSYSYDSFVKQFPFFSFFFDLKDSRWFICSKTAVLCFCGTPGTNRLCNDNMISQSENMAMCMPQIDRSSLLKNKIRSPRTHKTSKMVVEN